MDLLAACEGCFSSHRIQRNLTENLQISGAVAAQISKIAGKARVKSLVSFLSVERMRTVCRSTVPNVDLVQPAPGRGEFPGNRMVEAADEFC